MNNKKLGTDFENKVVEELNGMGYWVHFISPDQRGSQPFDIIAVKDGKAYAIDAKTCKAKSFGMNRVEDNQKLAFDKWMRCGNSEPMFFVEYEDGIKIVDWLLLKQKGSVKLNECRDFERYKDL